MRYYLFNFIFIFVASCSHFMLANLFLLARWILFGARTCCLKLPTTRDCKTTVRRGTFYFRGRFQWIVHTVDSYRLVDWVEELICASLGLPSRKVPHPWVSTVPPLVLAIHIWKTHRYDLRLRSWSDHMRYSEACCSR